MLLLIHIYKTYSVAVEELPHDVARLLGLLRVDPVAAVGDGLQRKPGKLRRDLLEVDGPDVARPLALDEQRVTVVGARQRGPARNIIEISDYTVEVELPGQLFIP